MCASRRPTKADPAADLRHAQAAYKAGNFDAALLAARRVTKHAPQNPDGWTVLMAAESAAGRRAAAIAAGEAARRHHPANATVLHNIGILAAEASRTDLADDVLSDALAIVPNDPALSATLAKVRLAKGQPELAEQAVLAALAEDEGDAELLFTHGNVALAQERPIEAADAFDRALARDPGHGPALVNLGAVREQLGQPGAALDAARRAVAQMPTSAAAHNNLGNIQAAQGRAVEAETAYREALRRTPGRPDTLTNLGHVLRDQGRFDDAVGAYREALAQRPQSGDAWLGLATTKRFAAADADRDAILEALKSSAVPLGDRFRLHYAAGRALASGDRDPDGAFRHYAEGARLKRDTLAYDVAADEAEMAALAANGIPVAGSAVCADDGVPAPVFIVGMPRSGTTLVEQILAAHSEVSAGGEQAALGNAIRAMARARAMSPADLAQQWDGATARELVSAYRARLAVEGGGAPVVTDKMPTNFRWMGFIAASFPDARILHVRRHPLDTCLSCFTRLFRRATQAFTYDLDELGRYYVSYARLAAAVGPQISSKQISEIWYEDLIADPEGETRRILDAVGLRWKEACLRFEDVERPVRTASATQVRQGLYTSSVGAWRAYAVHLAPLAERFRETELLDEAWNAIRR
jgi:tetratricopeptide (TPR) repeat protein